MMSSLPNFVTALMVLALLVYQAGPVRLDRAVSSVNSNSGGTGVVSGRGSTAVGDANSVVGQLLAAAAATTGGRTSALDEAILQKFDEEAYDTCRQYVALHDAQRGIGMHLPLQGVDGASDGSSWESSGVVAIGGAGDAGLADDRNEGDASPGSAVAALTREIRRSPSRTRAYAYRGQGEEGDYGASTEFTKIVTSKKRSCIRRGGSCDARPNDCCYHSSCRCNLWGTNCRCMRMGLLQRWINGKRR